MKTLTLSVIVLLVFGCMALVWAEQPSTTAQAPKTEQTAKSVKVEKPMVMVGEIVSVDTTANAIIVKQKSGKTETLKEDPKVIIKKSGNIIPLSVLAPGDKVTVSYKTEAGEKIATRIVERVAPVKKVTATKKQETSPSTK